MTCCKYAPIPKPPEVVVGGEWMICPNCGDYCHCYDYVGPVPRLTQEEYDEIVSRFNIKKRIRW